MQEQTFWDKGLGFLFLFPKDSTTWLKIRLMCIPDHIDNVTASSWQATATGVNEKQVPTPGQSLVAGWLYDTNIESKNLSKLIWHSDPTEETVRTTQWRYT